MPDFGGYVIISCTCHALSLSLAVIDWSQAGAHNEMKNPDLPAKPQPEKCPVVMH